MTWWSWLIALLAAVPLFFLWAMVHEVSHYLVARALRELVLVEFKLYPHVDERAGFRWAAVRWRHLGDSMTATEGAWVWFAPRWPNLLAALLFPLALLFPTPWDLVWALLWFGGLVDLAYGSVGWSEHSDLRRVARGWEISPWALRVGGWLLALTSSVPTLVAWLCL